MACKCRYLHSESESLLLGMAVGGILNSSGSCLSCTGVKVHSMQVSLGFDQASAVGLAGLEKLGVSGAE